MPLRESAVTPSLHVSGSGRGRRGPRDGAALEEKEVGARESPFEVVSAGEHPVAAVGEREELAHVRICEALPVRELGRRPVLLRTSFRHRPDDDVLSSDAAVENAPVAADAESLGDDEPSHDLRGVKTKVRLANEAFLGVNQSFETLHGPARSSPPSARHRRPPKSGRESRVRKPLRGL
jgi:hypothetical protein